MDAILALFRDPLVVVLLAILVFVGRVIFLAKRLKSAARNPTLVDLRALDEAKKALDKHHESLDEAKRTLEETIEGARDTLRGYKKPLAKAVNGRRKGLESEMKSLEHFDAPLKAARMTKHRTLEDAKHQTAFEDAKKLYKKTRPGDGRRARKPSKDM
jgi:hypothetical protein